LALITQELVGMPSIRRLSLITLVLLVFGALPAHGQGLLGALTGTVKDTSGAVLPGAVVRLESPALPGGERRTTTDEKGQWRFHLVPPGSYTLVVELTPRFRSVQDPGLTIGAGETVERTIVLAPAGVAESVTVTAGTLNPRTSGIETRFGLDYLRTMPTNRYSMFSLINQAPGVSPTSPSSGSINTVSVFGSAVNENAFLIDGTNFTCPCQGVSRAEPIVDVIQELHVQSVGASVEFGNLQGAVFNVVTRQGGSRVAADAAYHGQWAALTAQPVVAAVDRSALVTGYERIRYRDLTGSLGGPVRRDRLWFFSAFQYLRDYDSQPGANPSTPRRYEQNKVFGKLNWRLTPSLQLMQSFHREEWVNPPPPTVAAPFVTTQRLHASVPNMTFASLSHVVSDRTLWEFRLGRFLLRQDGDPNSGDRATPPHTDEITGIASGNVGQMTTLRLDRITAKAVLHHYRSGLFGVDHQFRAGAAFERGLHRLLQAIPGGVRYHDRNGAPFHAVLRAPSIAGGIFATPALFASDSFRVRNRLTVDAGVRFDHSRAIVPALPVVDAEGRETAERLPELGTVYTLNAVSPRLGASLLLDRAGRTMLRMSYGRFHQGVLTGELDPVSPGSAPTRTMAYDAETGGYTRFVSEVSGANLALDPNTRSPRTDEFSLAFDRELTPRLRASAAYIRKRGGDFLGWVDRGGEYRDDTRTLPDGTVVPVRVLTNSTADRRFFLTNQDTHFVHYDGMVLAIEKRMAGGWQASGSYTYSRAHGLQATSTAVAEEPQFSTIARAGFLTFGQDPNDLTNAAGRLANDRPHVVRAAAAWRLPWRAVLVAVNVQRFSGKPWAASTQVTLPQGSRRILLEPRGTRRLPSQSLIDLRVAKTVTLGAGTSVDVLLDVLNLLNDDAAEGLVAENPASATFGRPRFFITPRRAMLGVRLHLGR
jgi:hypothetical protein